MIKPYEVLGNILVCFGNPSVFELVGRLRQYNFLATNVYILLTSSVLRVSFWIFGLVHHFSRFVSLVALSKHWSRCLEPVGLAASPVSCTVCFMAVNFLIFSHLIRLV